MKPCRDSNINTYNKLIIKYLYTILIYIGTRHINTLYEYIKFYIVDNIIIYRVNPRRKMYTVYISYSGRIGVGRRYRGMPSLYFL